MSDADQPFRQLDDSTKNELARALGNAAPDDTAASDDTGTDVLDAADFGANDSWVDFTPIPEHIDPVAAAEAPRSVEDAAFDQTIDSVRIIAARPGTPLAPPAPAPSAASAPSAPSAPVAPQGSLPAPDAREHQNRPKIIRIDDFAGSHEVTNSSVSPFPTNDPTVASTDQRAGAAGAPSNAPRVVTIGDDDLPDAVFVKGSLDGSASSVVIIDDAGDEALSPLNSPAGTRRSIEPRLRDRRVAVKREAGRRRLRLALLICIVVGVVVGVATVVASPLFAVRRDDVTVTGVVYTDQGLLEGVIDQLVGTPTLRVDTQAIEAQLDKIPWVETSRVKVTFPHTATIDIRERRAMSTYQGPDGRFRVIDIDGRVLAVIDGYPIAYMLVYLPDAPALEAGDQAPIGLVAAAELTKVLTPEVRELTQSITTVSDGSSIELNFKDGTRVIFGPATDLVAKVIRLQTRLQQASDPVLGGPETPADGAVPKVIDVSTPETGG